MNNWERRKLQPQEVRAVRRWWAELERARALARLIPTPAEMARRMNIASGALYSIARGRSYKEVR